MDGLPRILGYVEHCGTGWIVLRVGGDDEPVVCPFCATFIEISTLTPPSVPMPAAPTPWGDTGSRARHPSSQPTGDEPRLPSEQGAGWCDLHKVEHQPRERAVPCLACGRPAWHPHATCPEHGGA